MTGLMPKFILLLFIFLPLLSIINVRAPIYANAEDSIEEEEEIVVEEGQTGTDVEDTGEEPQDAVNVKGSPNADTIIQFTKPTNDGSELPANKLVEFLVGFTNNGNQDFVLDSIDASFRYPMDFSFYIQNFTVITLNNIVKPRHESTVMYSFYPSEAFAGRQLGLTIFLTYHNDDGHVYEEAVFNQTVSIIDVDEGMDGETFFLYIFLLAFAVLLLLGGHHLLTSYGRKKGEGKKKQIETGTTNKKGIDYDWIPKEVLETARRSQPNSPRQRKSRK